MAGLIHKENNFNGVKEGSNTSHVIATTYDRVKILDSLNGQKFLPHIFGKDLSNNQIELKETNHEKFDNTKQVSNCNARTNNGKRQRESLLEGNHKADDDHSDIGVQVGKETPHQMKKHRRRKVILDSDDDCFGDQSLMAIKYNVKGPIHVEQKSYCCSKPIDEPTWRGIFKIGQKYLSLAGHLLTKYGEKVWKLSRSLLLVVETTKLSRPNEELDELLKEVIENDLVLRAIVGEAQMLIFPSILLPEQYKTFKRKHYLWGVFKHKEDKGVKVVEPSNVIGRHAQVEVEKEAHYFSINQDEKQDQETMFTKTATPSKNEDLPTKNTYRVTMPNMGFEPKVLDKERQKDVLHRAMCSGEAMVSATNGNVLQANYAQSDESKRLPSGKLFGFIVGQSPRLLQLIQEMECEGGVVIAMQGEMIGK